MNLSSSTRRIRRILFWLLGAAAVYWIAETPTPHFLLFVICFGLLCGGAIEFTARLAKPYYLEPPNDSPGETPESPGVLSLVELCFVPSFVAILFFGFKTPYQIKWQYAPELAMARAEVTAQAFIANAGIAMLAGGFVLAIVFQLYRAFLPASAPSNASRTKSDVLRWLLAGFVVAAFFFTTRYSLAEFNHTTQRATIDISSLASLLLYAVPIFLIVPGIILSVNRRLSNQFLFYSLYIPFVCFFRFAMEVRYNESLPYLAALSQIDGELWAIAIALTAVPLGRWLYGPRNSAPATDWQLSFMGEFRVVLAARLIVAGALVAIGLIYLQPIIFAGPDPKTAEGIIAILEEAEGVEATYYEHDKSLEIVLSKDAEDEVLRDLRLSVFDSVVIEGRRTGQTISPWGTEFYFRNSSVASSELTASQLNLDSCEIEWDGEPPTANKWTVTSRPGSGSEQRFQRNLEAMLNSKKIRLANFVIGHRLTPECLKLLYDFHRKVGKQLILYELENDDLVATLRLLKDDNQILPILLYIDLKQGLPLQLLQSDWLAEFMTNYPVKFSPTQLSEPSPEALPLYMRLFLVAPSDGLCTNVSIFFLEHFAIEAPEMLRTQLIEAGLSNEAGTALFLPHYTEEIGTSVVKAFPDLKYLCIDIARLGKNAAANMGIERDALPLLSQLKKLEYLSLPYSAPITDLKWIQATPSLKLLDAKVVVDTKALGNQPVIRKTKIPRTLRKLRRDLRTSAGLQPSDGSWLNSILGN